MLMRTRLARVIRWLLIIAVTGAALLGGLGFWAEHYIRKQLDEFVTRSCAVIAHGTEPSIAVSVIDRAITVHDLHLLPIAGCADTSTTIHGTIDTLEIGGVSISGLFFHDRLEAAYLRASSKGLSIALHGDTIAIDSVQRPVLRISAAFGDVRLRMTTSVLASLSADTIRFGADTLLLSATDLHFQNDADSGARITTSRDLRLNSKGLHAFTASGYAWTLERCEIDQRGHTLSFIGAHVQPVQCIEEHSAAMDVERDVFDARLDTLRIDQVEMGPLLAQGVLKAGAMVFAHGDVTVLRDKTLPDDRWRHKPLLARLVRSFPEGTNVDTIKVAALDVRYRERSDRERGFALIPFTRINSTITGVRNVAGDTTALVLHARCTSFSDTRVEVELSTVIQDTTDRMVVNASVGRLPFSAIRQATGPLVGVQATEGVMDSLIYHMVGNDRRASGTVRMTYSGLKLEAGWKKRRQALNDVGTVLLNAIVKDKGRDKDGTLRIGEFTLDRRRDRAVFNYLWSGLREGSKAVILPNVITGDEGK